MIGQKNNIERIDKWATTDCPQFIILIGSRGSGKRTLTGYIASKLKTGVIPIGIKVDDIREMINIAQTTKGVYGIYDADSMSGNAKNAMLKIVEEPPKDTYFIMTVQDDSSLLETIKSRAQIIKMEPYTRDELVTYRPNQSSTIYEIAQNPYEVDLLSTYGSDFFSYVNLVIDNISEVEPANAFKSSNKLALKNEEDKYVLGLFMQTFIRLCITRALIEPDYKKYARWIVITGKYYTKQSYLGANKQQLYDMWVFEIRSAV